ncbi:hypothetical protein [Pyxidicoccus xibeiensis]|uniref:hypothetical protein n=1 Tax=Pyxidicoccus xibeiensis TaxID=2906759 RepID=UPI0020A83285|nr:hypothetical protein [Pyxidicoccus xibeiensis]MCP3140486.1 hypothetical protein [Pyxidicoccus xibeiensis]
MLKRTFLSALFAFFGAITGLVVCALLTPIFWRLEGPLGLELAGHSGPAEGLLIGFAAVSAFVGFTVAFRRRRT